jgi:hypothetical protein
MNRLIDLRPLASAAVLAVAAMGVAPAFAAQPYASSLSRVSQQARSMPTFLRRSRWADSSQPWTPRQAPSRSRTTMALPALSR